MDPSVAKHLEAFRLIGRLCAGLHGRSSEQEILDAIADAFCHAKGFNAFLLMAGEDAPTLRIAATSYPPDLIREVETAQGISNSSLRTATDGIPLLARALRTHDVFQAPTPDVLREIFPPRAVPAIERHLDLESQRSLLVPVHRRGRAAGVLVVTADDLTEVFIELLKNMACGVNAALDATESPRDQSRSEYGHRNPIGDRTDVIFSVDAQERFTYISPNVVTLGYTQAGLLGHSFSELLDPEDSAKLGTLFQQHLRGECTSGHAEYRLRSAGGGVRWIRISSRNILEDGSPIGVEGSIAEITDRKLAELGRKESDRRLITLMSTLPGMAYRCRNEPDWPMEFVSNGSVDLTGYPPEDLIENRVVPYGSLIHKDDRAYVWKEVQAALATGRPFTLEYRITTANGDEKWVWEQGKSVPSDHGQGTTLEGTIIDVTARRHAEQALRTSEQRLSFALEATSDGLWDWDVASGRAYFSPRYYTMLGYEPNAFDPSYDTWKSLLHPEDREETIRIIQEHVDTKSPNFAVEFRLRTKDGNWRWILSRGRVVERMPGGQPVRMVGTHVDITQQKEDAEALKLALGGTTRAIARTVELRDPYTAGHQERVAHLACAIAREMGTQEELIPTLRVAGLLHDVGKIAVPSEILSKPSRLTDPEMRIVQMHVEAGFTILDGITLPWPIAEIVRSHHERLDGSGYPRGLKGKAISIASRILSVADVVEAMSSHRPYRPALGLEVSLAEIEQGRGTRYDTQAVDACLSLFRDKGLTFDNLADDLCQVEA